MVKALNRLETLGWSVLARDFLKLRAGEARMLSLLACERPGQVVSYDALSDCRWSPHEATGSSASLRMAVRIAKVRRALTECGFARSVIQNIPLNGYLIHEADARQIRRLVEDGVMW